MTQPIIGPMPLTEAWFAEHKTHVSATSIARIMEGAGFAVYSEMRGETPPFAGNFRTRRGQRHERPILEEYAEMKPAMLIANLPLLIDGDCSALAATPDALAVTPYNESDAIGYLAYSPDNPLNMDYADTWGVEAKWSASKNIANQIGEEESDEVPAKWIWQVQCQMAVTGWPFVDIALELWGEPKTFTVQRHPTLIDACRATAVEMMDRVRRGLPPPIDFASTANQDAVKALYGKPTIGKIIDLDAAAEAVWQRRDEHQKAESAAKKSKEAADSEMLAIMAGSEMGSFPDGSTLRRGTVTVKERIQPGYEYSRFWYKKG